MDLVTIDPDTYTPVDLVENYNSLIWTERYTELGELELKTKEVGLIRNALPEWTLVSLLDSDQVMRIETHQIDEDAEGNDILTVKGRAIESIFEGRYVNETSSSIAAADMGADYIGVEAILNYLFYSMEGIWGDSGYDNLFNANIKITDSTNHSRPDLTRFWSRGDVYTPIHNLLSQMRMGFRSIRPRLDSVTVNRVDPPLYPASAPPYVRTPDANPTYMCFDVYDGVDRSSSSGALNPVAFEVLNGAIKGSKYLISRANFFTAVIVYEEVGTIFVRKYVPGWDPATNPNAKGLDYRLKAVSGGQRGTLTDSQMTTYMQQLCNLEIAKCMNTISVDFAVQNTPSTPVYNQDYFLGDLVDLRMKYGIIKQGRVTEFIRSKDANGIKQFPTITVIEPT